MPLAPSQYLLASIAVGTLQMADAAALVKYQGRVGLLATVFSLVELGWAVVSWLVWSRADPAVPGWLSASFVAYFAAFMAGGLALAVFGRGRLQPVPPYLMVAGGIFGLYFAGASAVCAMDV